MMNLVPADQIKIPQGLWKGLGRLGIPAHEVARQARLPMTIMSEPAVTTTQYFAIWQAYFELAGETAAAIIELATTYETAQYPPSLLATYHARNYYDALHRMTQYKQLCPPENLRITEDGELCVIELEWLYGGRELAGPPMLMGLTLACLLELGRRGTATNLSAYRVEFSQPMGDSRTLEAYFGCPICTNATGNRLILRRSDLDRPFVSYNEELLEILTPALDRTIYEHDNIHFIAEKVKSIIKRRLADGCPDIGGTAHELGISDRTLQRRLAEEHTSFKQLLTQARHELALAYLADPSLDIKQIASLIGYEDQNSFYRAFRIWEGDTPAHWRLMKLGKTAF